MKNFDYDYKNNDKITIFAQRDKFQEIIEYYKIFKWELVSNNNAKNSSELVELTFLRPHKIKNKDKLQLYQVQMEEYLNNIGRLENSKNTKSTTLGLILGLIFAIPIVLGILMLCNVIHTPTFVSIFLISIGAILTGINFALIFRLNIKEDKIFNNKKRKLNQELKHICNKVKILLEETNDKEKSK